MSSDLRVEFTARPAAIRLVHAVSRRVGERGPGGGHPHARPDSERSKDAGERPGSAPAGKPSGGGVDVTGLVAGPKGGAPIADAAHPDAKADPGTQGSQTREKEELARSGAVPPEWMHLQSRFLELIAELERQAEERSREVGDELKNLTPAVVDLALAIASKVVHDDLTTGGLQLVPIIEEALAKVLSGVEEEAPIRARVGAEMAEVARAVLGDRLGDATRFHLTVDAALPGRTVELQCDMRKVTVDAKDALERLADQLRAGVTDV